MSALISGEVPFAQIYCGALVAAGFAYEGIGRPSSPLDMLPEIPEPDLSEAEAAREE